MFLRKFLKSESKQPDAVRNGPPAGMQAMGANLQRKFAKGVQYNMKIIIKGDRNVGKSCLLQRLQGLKFKEEYIPTDEIQVANIQWSYKATNDVVKVEVWDVVDKGKKKKKVEGLKLDSGATLTLAKCKLNADVVQSCEDTCLDADFVDVYKGTHGVIVVFDITKQWTYEYVERELPKMPPTLPILVLANHRDMGHHRVTTDDQARSFIEHLERPENSAQIRYVETSMKSGFGLKYIHKFFNLPFLHLQRETLLRQLETNAQEIQLSFQELDMHEESDEQNYDLFLDVMTTKRREQQEQLAAKAIEEAALKRREELAAAAAAAAAANAAQQSGPPPPAAPAAVAAGPLTIKEAPPPRPIPGLSLALSKPSTPRQSNTTSPVEVAEPAEPDSVAVSSKSAPVTPAAERPVGFMSRLFGGGTTKRTVPPAETTEVTSPQSPVGPVQSVDEFSPDGEGLDASFLDDVKENKSVAAAAASASAAAGHSSDSDDDVQGVNPLVAGFQDDLDSDDERIVARGNAPPRSNIDDHSSDEEEDNYGARSRTKDFNKNSRQSSISATTNASISSSTSKSLSSRSLGPPDSMILTAPQERNRKGGDPGVRTNPTPIGIVHPSLPSGGGVPVTGGMTGLTTGGITGGLIAAKPSGISGNSAVTGDSGGDFAKKGSVGAVNWGGMKRTLEPSLLEGDLSSSEGEEEGPAVLQGLEDVEDETSTAIGRRPANQADATEVAQSLAQPLYTLNFDDLSQLEKRFESSSLHPGKSGRTEGSDPLSSSSSSKSKKHKSKDKKADKDGDSAKLEKKHRKHKERSDDADKPKTSGGGDPGGDSTEKAKHRAKKEHRKKNELNDLEAFLGSAGPYESL